MGSAQGDQEQLGSVVTGHSDLTELDAVTRWKLQDLVQECLKESHKRTRDDDDHESSPSDSEVDAIVKNLLTKAEARRSLKA